jgi:hypothetical protein
MARGLIPFLVAKLRRFLCGPKERRATRIACIDDSGAELEEGEMGKPLSNTNLRPIVLVPKTARGGRDKIQSGSMTATSGNPSLATIALDPNDEFKAWITPVDDADSGKDADGNLIPVEFHFTADADLREGVVPISGLYSCPIVDEAATVIEPEEGEDVPKP